MKTRAFIFAALTALMISGTAQETKRQYILPKDLTITSDGIFVNTGSEVMLLESISYDYSEGKFYSSSREEVGLITCPRCGNETYSPKLRMCFTPRCQQSWNLLN
jgi:hypothetical protein